MNKLPDAKRRTTADLVSFVRTRADACANYTLLLGSGASVTSGIKTGRHLIDQWRRDLYVRCCPTPIDPYDPNEAQNFLTKNEGQWYSPLREYSCLFEKKFDLARQRRAFVENEVANKLPSMGYAYLVRLVQEGYFSTIFTTNFDDLLNEAFHQFSDIRPIICAHDSSISSITVTARRPKIVKLHGDYLFDDIKSTVKETESLEDNTKKKFIEFAKDHGLIVIGYSGHDRSVMDVLQHLLKNEDYLKNGIYWCHRKGDEPSEELTKLLWRDRAYFVEVDGFDELMAELYFETIGEALPIDTNIVSEKPRDVVRRFCNDEYLKTSDSHVIKQHLADLRRELEQEALVESVREVFQPKESDENSRDIFSDREAIKLMSIRNRIPTDIRRAHSEIMDELGHCEKFEYRVELLRLKLRIERKENDIAGALKTIDALIELDDKEAYFFLEKAKSETSQDRRLAAISNAISVDPFYASAHSLRASMLLEEFEASPHSSPQDIISKILSDYQQSIKLNPVLSNPVWLDYIDFLLHLKKHGYGDASAIEQLLGIMETMDAYSERYLTALVKYVCHEKKEVSKTKPVLDKIRKARELQPRSRKKQFDILYLDSLLKMELADEFRAEILKYESEYARERKFVLMKARALAEMDGNILEAGRTLEAYKGRKRDVEISSQLIKYLCYWDQFDKALAIYEECKAIFDRSTAFALELEISSSRGDWDRAYALIRARKSEEVFGNSSVTLETHALIKLKRFDEARAICKSYLTACNFDLMHSDLIINYELANMRQGKGCDKARVGRIRDHASGPLEKACAHLLLEESSKATELLKETIQESKISYYEIRGWAIFDTPANRQLLLGLRRYVGASFSEDSRANNQSISA